MMSDSEDIQNAGRELKLDDHSHGRRALPAAAIITATFIAYAATLRFGFVYDDHILIEGNDAISSWRYLPTYFNSHIWSWRYPHLLSNAYRPLLMIWLRLNEMAFGLHPWGWHLTSVAIHIAVSYLVYRLALRVLRDTWWALFCGLVFGLQPVHIEVVACVSGVDFPLSTCFVLAAVLAWWRSRESERGTAWLVASLVLCGAALLTKETSLMLPVLIGGVAWIYDEGREAGAWARVRSGLAAAAPFLAVTLAYVPLRIWALKGFIHPATRLAPSTAFFTVPSVALFYLRLLGQPTRLSCYYDTPYVSAPTLAGFGLPLAVILAVGAVLVYWYWRIRVTAPQQARALELAVFWLGIFLAPALNLGLLPEGEIMHDRYLYLPSVGFALLLGLVFRQIFSEHRRAQMRPGWIARAAVIIGVLMMAGLTMSQSLYWADDLSLNYHAHEIAPHNVDAMASLGAAVAARGMDSAAMGLYKQALEIRPDLWRGNVNLAYLYYAHGNFPEAAQYFARACAADPSDGDQFLYLGMSLLRMGRPSDAEKAVRTALQVRPQGKNFHLGLGMVLRQEGRLAEARQEFEAELAEDPQNAQARALLDDVTRRLESPTEKPSVEKPSTEKPSVDDRQKVRQQDLK
jgi:tetratricopeptide (TPR) repeat protein